MKTLPRLAPQGEGVRTFAHCLLLPENKTGATSCEMIPVSHFATEKSSFFLKPLNQQFPVSAGVFAKAA